MCGLGGVAYMLLLCASGIWGVYAVLWVSVLWVWFVHTRCVLWVGTIIVFVVVVWVRPE